MRKTQVNFCRLKNFNPIAAAALVFVGILLYGFLTAGNLFAATGNVTLVLFGGGHVLEIGRSDRPKRLFDENRAIVSPVLLQNLSINVLSKYYQTKTAIVRSWKAVQDSVSLIPLPDVKPNETCVIVGSSGILLQYPRLGAKIDNYDHVIRINFPPTVGYEDFVGNKTTLFFGYLSSVRKSIDTPRQPSGAHILYSGTYSVEFSKLTSMLTQQPKTRPDKVSAVLRSNNLTFYGHYTRQWIFKELMKNNKVRPTTGLEAMVIISSWCPTRPDYAGFSLPNSKAPSSHRKAPYHYFDNHKLHFSAHRPSLEVMAIQKLKDSGLLGNDLCN